MSSPAPQPSADPPTHPPLAAVGLDGPWPTLLTDLAPGLTIGRVTRADRSAATVLTADGPRRASVTSNEEAPVTGDWVALHDDGRVAAIAPRATALTRPSTVGREQVLAANMDLVGVVAALDRPLNTRRLERGVVMAYSSGALPVVLLTKADLSTGVADAVAAARRTAVAVDVIALSTVSGDGLDALRSLLAPNRTIALLGASGSGKSTLTNALSGAEVLATAAVRERDGKGRHTTSHRELVALPCGGAILDTPGLRTLSLGEVGAAEMDRVFPEIDEMAAACRFRDCRHDHEPGCAVTTAAAEGTLDPDRLEGWRRIRAASENAALRADVAAWRRTARGWGRLQREAQQIRGRDGRR